MLVSNTGASYVLRLGNGKSFVVYAKFINSRTKNIIFINSANFVNMIEQCLYICSSVPETTYLTDLLDRIFRLAVKTDLFLG